jgi:hypothetical protein
VSHAGTTISADGAVADGQAPAARSAALYKEYAEDFGQLEDIVVEVESPEIETSTAYAASLVGVLRAGALGTARISYRVDASRIEAHALLYLPLETLREALRTVASHEELLADFAATPTLVQRPHNHRGLRQPARCGSSGRVEPGLAARDRLRGDADRLPGGFAHARASRRRAPAITG